eukprot:CAMPEP_0174293432 /NCGR_PEP_ID=MMETSP0809-20121228/38566_1 /TAXON_ID=73025 ORGANISM="Eutreptiella gymnastica-like, Strain CCMP1594" /NCGR_SAMPLE_ID=MMETSP0809 /ASSEMBLY_ACC=CAM_ASM_000658 /LENGTH=153 /DNA_ID=CAMNT_0015394211 /DNA_START=42 /DNA_END=500 /DNA_ORIENTATION=-
MRHATYLVIPTAARDRSEIKMTAPPQNSGVNIDRARVRFVAASMKTLQTDPFELQRVPHPRSHQEEGDDRGHHHGKDGGRVRIAILDPKPRADGPGHQHHVDLPQQLVRLNQRSLAGLQARPHRRDGQRHLHHHARHGKRPHPFVNGIQMRLA